MIIFYFKMFEIRKSIARKVALESIRNNLPVTIFSLIFCSFGTWNLILFQYAIISKLKWVHWLIWYSFLSPARYVDPLFKRNLYFQTTIKFSNDMEISIIEIFSTIVSNLKIKNSRNDYINISQILIGQISIIKFLCLWQTFCANRITKLL